MPRPKDSLSCSHVFRSPRRNPRLVPAKHHQGRQKQQKHVCRFLGTADSMDKDRLAIGSFLLILRDIERLWLAVI